MSVIVTACVLLRPVTKSFLRSYRRWSCVHRCYNTGSIKSTVEFSKKQQQKLRNLEQHFKKRLLAVHQRFAGIPDSAVVWGRHHVYTEDGGAIYRMAFGQGEQDLGEVFRADWAGDVGGTIQRVRLSPTESVLAVTVKSSLREEARCLLVRLDADSEIHQPMLILDKVFSFEWATDKVLFYSTQEGLQCRKVFRLLLSDRGSSSTLVYEEKNPEFFVEVSRSRDHRLVTVNCSSKDSSEAWIIDSTAPISPPVLVQSRLPGLLYHVEHSENQLYILANTGPGQEYQLLRAPVSSPSMPNWVPVFTPSPWTVIKDMEMLRNHCVVSVRDSTGLLQLQTVPLENPKQVSTFKLPAWACCLETQQARMMDRETFRFFLSSPVHPPVCYLLSPGHRQPFSQEEDPQQHHLQECYTTRLQASSQDGTLVPITLFHMPALDQLGRVPLLVHVYGAYGLDINMSFCPEKRLLLEGGWALAYCHVRGGGERGLAWHRAGHLLQKQRGVEDLAACIQTLFHQGISQPGLTALTARSAGAVLAAALCNQHPQLLTALTMQAPFLDVLGTMQDPSLPLTVEETGEWGDPLTDPQYRECIASYCPCHNIKPQRYPSVLITAYQDDKRIPLSGVLKYAERLKKAVHTHKSSLLSEPGGSVILNLQPGGDHFGPEDFDLSLNESAKQMAFLHMELGLEAHGYRRRRK